MNYITNLLLVTNFRSVIKMFLLLERKKIMWTTILLDQWVYLKIYFLLVLRYLINRYLIVKKYFHICTGIMKTGLCNWTFVIPKMVRNSGHKDFKDAIPDQKPKKSVQSNCFGQPVLSNYEHNSVKGNCVAPSQTSWVVDATDHIYKRSKLWTENLTERNCRMDCRDSNDNDNAVDQSVYLWVMFIRHLYAEQNQ